MHSKMTKTVFWEHVLSEFAAIIICKAPLPEQFKHLAEAHHAVVDFFFKLPRNQRFMDDPGAMS